MSSSNKDEEELSPPEPPKITKTKVVDDPVQLQRQLDPPPPPPSKKKAEIPEKQSIISAKIQPSVGTRIGLQYVHEVTLEEGQPRLKYVVPMLKRRQQKTLQKDKHQFCKYGLIKLPDPTPNRKVDLDVTVPSPEISSAKVAPRRATPTASWAYPYPPTEEELQLKKPKSGIFINETEQPEKVTDYDSFDLLYSKTPRPSFARPGKQKRSKKRRASALGDITEGDEDKVGGGGKRRKKKKKKKKKGVEPEAEDKEPSLRDILLAMAEEELAEGMGEGEGLSIESYLTKQFRRKVSMISAATSYKSKDIRSLLSEEILEEPAVNKYIQKFRRDSEIKRYQPKKRKFKRGTLQSHSFTRMRQPHLRDFFFGSKEGSMHQGNENFPENIRNKQGLCMSVAAYCFSILKHPNLWTCENVDEILEIGNNLCLASLDKLHMHEMLNELKPDELLKYCVIGDKKIRFLVDEPEVSGQKAGILKTQDISLAIWKDKYYYMYDSRPRTKDLYRVSNGTAIMANFYDIPSMITVLLERSNFENWPFVIYTLKAFKVLNKDDPEVDSTVDLDVKSNYNIMDENKAVVQASFELGDKCFDFSRNKQSLAMATVCLVYSRITPPSAWHKTTLDKIMIIGNQLYLEIMECECIVDVRVDNLPAFFTIGPYIVEIYIYMNMYGDLMFKKCCCQLKSNLESFFERSTNGILQIGKFYLAVWKQRNMYYCFDPYSRNAEGLKCRDGAACVSMHSNLPSLVSTVAVNFDSNEYVFYLHAVKVCKIHRDPVQSSRFPRHLTMDDFPAEDFVKYKMKKSRKPATEKPVTVDYSALAMRRLLAGESPTSSIFEIGSTVESLGMDEIPPMVHKFPSRSVLKAHPKKTDVIADLDSPSLSDTQIEPPLPTQPKDDEIEFMDLDSFELTQEEIELQQFELDVGEGEDYIGGAGDYEGLGEGDYGEGEDDWYYVMNEYAQVGEFSLPKDVSRISEQINTDITYFPINRDVLYPTYMRGKQQMRRRLHFTKDKDEAGWEVYVPTEPTVTKSEELRKETNFIDLPDDTQIIRGTKNVVEFGKDVEYIAPFVCIMAAVVSKNELYAASKFRYDQVAKLEIPRITLGASHFKVLVEYIFDTYTRQNILELAIEKILFVRSDMGVLVTPTYACALFYKNHLYYMYDGFGSNEDIHSLATRIMYNKTKRESNEMIVYTRFVLSSIKVKTLHPSQDDVKQKKKKKKSKRKDDEAAREEAELDRMAGEDEGMASTGLTVNINVLTGKMENPCLFDDLARILDRLLVRSAPKKEDEEEGDEEEEKDKRKTATNIVGYQYKNGIYVVEGTKHLDDRQQISDELKPDHFACLCACLLLLTCPVKKWDTKKVNQVIDHGKHVFSHADDLEISERRTIKNVLIQRHFFDIIVKKLKIENWRDNKNLNTGESYTTKPPRECLTTDF
ncbi:hypothetical protein NQ318_005727 [Aromia moschata]|uniref:Uncharacterized protein n=1 Tax=Aromia moschata TaxID=1265417 RepID=A0AAV8YQY5_9CUCU|nr:hypothetical protein NQ318_005727 [Aromia moschata]